MLHSALRVTGLTSVLPKFEQMLIKIFSNWKPNYCTMLKYICDNHLCPQSPLLTYVQ